MTKPNYGIDAAPVTRNLALVGLAGWTLFAICSATGFLGGIKNSFLSLGISFLVASCLMVLYAKVGKFVHRERMLAMIDWRGDEQVLDVGTGRGLLMIGAAKKLTTGRSIGIDIWNAAALGIKTKKSYLTVTLNLKVPRHSSALAHSLTMIL